MFRLSQASASRRPLLSVGLLDTPMSLIDWAPRFFSWRTNRTASCHLRMAAQIVGPKPIEMNTCVKTGGGGGDSSRSGLKLLTFPSLWESYSCTKIMNNSHGIILFQKNRGVGHVKLYLNSEFQAGDGNASMICS